MSVADIPLLTVSYNTPQLLHDLLESVRRFYANTIHVVDGSDAEHAEAIRAVAARFAGVELHAKGYNIHHGPGMSWGLRELALGPRVLVVDSDVVFLRAGLIEALDAALPAEAYGVGAVQAVNRGGFNVPAGAGAIPYLHPAMMLCNREVLLRWPMPVKHGAPMIEAMVALHDAGRSDLLVHLDWVLNDFSRETTEKVYFDHLWQGTVKRTGGYHLDEWMNQAREDAAALAELARYLPAEARRVGVLSLQPAELVKLMPGREVLVVAPDAAELPAGPLDAWVLDGALARVADPWKLLERLRERLAPGGCVVARVANAQHWRQQGLLAIGEYRYGTAALERAQLRAFTRVTMFELLQSAGFAPDAGAPRLDADPKAAPVLQGIRQVALAMGRDPEGAAKDAQAVEFIVRARRAGA
ncbi:MAG: glycosyltransferase [Pelomonas sp.]|nr:glycosyltransferase [Roseateles sp.]